MTSQSAEAYRAKAAECRCQADSAPNENEKESCLKRAAEWDALALEADVSGNLPWTVKS
jgi:hypothetical protein